MRGPGTAAQRPRIKPPKPGVEVNAFSETLDKLEDHCQALFASAMFTRVEALVLRRQLTSGKAQHHCVPCHNQVLVCVCQTALPASPFHVHCCSGELEHSFACRQAGVPRHL